MFSLYGLDYVPQPLYVDVLTSGSQGCDCIWKESPCRCNSLGWGHTTVGWAPESNTTDVLRKKRKFRHRRTHREKVTWRWRPRSGGCFSKQRNTRDCSKPPRGETWDRFSSITLRRKPPHLHLAPRILASRPVRQYISVVSATQSEVLYYVTSRPLRPLTSAFWNRSPLKANTKCALFVLEPPGLSPESDPRCTVILYWVKV